MKFTKMHGCGNDYVYVNCFEETFPECPVKREALVRQLSDRHFGIGGDGVIFICPSEKADAQMRMFNADGSESEMCGNGVRCVAKYVFDRKIADKDEIAVDTLAGIKIIRVMERNPDGTASRLRVDMGEPIFAADEIPVDGFGSQKLVGEPIVVDGVKYKMTCVSMGNPHCVVFVDDISTVDLEKIGRKFETHEIFPRKTNTEFVQVVGENKLRMRVWERGSGITLACGTGACATAVAANLNGLAGKKSTVILDGGELQIEWRDNNHIFMTGAAEKVYAGEFNFPEELSKPSTTTEPTSTTETTSAKKSTFMDGF